MNPRRFDRISRHFSERRISRRGAMTEGVAQAVGADAAQDATPETAATPLTSPAPTAGDKTMFLFVQSFRSGNIGPAAGDYGTHTVTLEQGLGQTIYFADRPSREVGATPTPAFLDGLGFDADNPPNAAILMDAGDGTTDIAVIELFNPTYDEATHTATYDIGVLANWQNDLELGFNEAPTDLANVPTEFGATHLFIDDCPNLDIKCVVDVFPNNVSHKGVYEDQGTCWNYSVCMPCVPYGHVQPSGCATYNYWKDKCNADFPECGGKCYVFTAWPFAEAGC